MSAPVQVQRFASARVAACGALALALAGALLVLLAPERQDAWQPLLGAAIGFPMVVAFGSAILAGQERLAWVGVTAGMVLTVAAGHLGMPGGQALPATAWSLGDVVWAVRFPILYGGVALIVISRSPAFGLRQILDGLIGAFAAAALMELLVVPWMAAGAHADATTVALHTRYPLLDMAVVGFLVGAAALNAWPVRTWLPLAADMALFLICQVVDVHGALAHPGEAMSWVTYPGYLAAGWLIATVVYALRARPGQAD